MTASRTCTFRNRELGRPRTWSAVVSRGLGREGSSPIILVSNLFQLHRTLPKSPKDVQTSLMVQYEGEAMLEIQDIEEDNQEDSS